LIIAGPTASGKTSIGVQIALETGAELVGADSMQVYRKLDIGTAKPTLAELQGIPHHLIDVADPDEPFDAERFVTEADRAIADIAQRNRKIIVVGGTGLYIRALLHGLHKGPKPAPEIRTALMKRAASEGWPALHAELAAKDPVSATKLHPNDGVRILRALEVFEESGIPMSEWQKQHGFAKQRYPALLLGLTRPREGLYRRINNRVDEMMGCGFLAEVEALIDGGYGPELKPMQGLGYRRMAQHITGELNLAEAVEKTKTDTRRFAKRQLTWFKREPGLAWCEPNHQNIIAQAKLFWHEFSQQNVERL
jgi:tRNA dimethylallyltransferase